MRTLATVALAILMIASSCSSSCSPRECVDAMNAYARASQAAPRDEDDHAYDDFVAIAARAPKDGDGTCRAVAALSTHIAAVRAERAAARASASKTAPTAAPSERPRAEEGAASRHEEAPAPADATSGATAGDDDGRARADAGTARNASADSAADDAADGDAADDADDDADQDHARASGRSRSLASSPDAVASPVNVSRAVAEAQASSSVFACRAGCANDQRGCLGRCDAAWRAGESVGAYRDCQSRCNGVEVKCRRACAPRRRAADAGPR